MDGRRYPWGDVFDWSFTVGRRSLEKPLGPGGIPAPAGSCPLDESPYGVSDMAGNVSEWCRDIVDIEGKPFRYVAGGSRGSSQPDEHLVWPRTAKPLREFFGDFTGFRMVIELD